MAISDVKLPAGVHAHQFKSPVLLAEGLALNVAKQLSDAISARGNAVRWFLAVAVRWRFSSTWPSRSWTGRRSS